MTEEQPPKVETRYAERGAKRRADIKAAKSAAAGQKPKVVKRTPRKADS